MSSTDLFNLYQTRLASKDDCENIVDYIDNTGMVFHSKGTVRRMVCGDDKGRKPYTIGLALYQDEIIGIAIVSSKSKTLSLLFVSEDYRKYGVGRRLLEITSPQQLLIKLESLEYFYKVYRRINS